MRYVPVSLDIPIPGKDINSRYNTGVLNSFITNFNCSVVHAPLIVLLPTEAPTMAPTPPNNKTPANALPRPPSAMVFPSSKSSNCKISSKEYIPSSAGFFKAERNPFPAPDMFLQKALHENSRFCSSIRKAYSSKKSATRIFIVGENTSLPLHYLASSQEEPLLSFEMTLHLRPRFLRFRIPVLLLLQ